MTIRKPYCAGFLFQQGSVLLCKKNAPPWQVGYWNAIGGKIENGETAVQAIAREGVEEIHLESHHMLRNRVWDRFAVETHQDYVVHFFRAWASDAYLPPTQNDVGEQLTWHSPRDLCDVIGNLHWLIPLAMDWRRFDRPLEVHALDNITERPSW